ncbi:MULTISPECIES: tryptophan halogenase family protein [Pseudoalteromonas]|uniref:tryptophan halogenase family protein n=1 Tax=Pseudoalteromonas TaxID=53246 RepID=UPI000FFEB49D|nr:tryptophan halogenase family protein [Pseudoalteromonas sp. A757]RXE89255.1 tryptophan 7-halogenase [Pseudoalteromonas sp. A757]
MNERISNSVPKSIAIIGGGTAGWMSAILLKSHWVNTRVILIESPDVPVIGVGEGSTPALKYFFQSLNIDEKEWMQRCNATYKVGIQFPNWSTVQGYESYFHPFFSALDSQTSTAFVKQAKKWRQGERVNVLPDNFFVAASLAKKHKAIITKKPLPIELDYGYHFDSALLGDYLKEKSIERGVIYQEATVDSVIHSDKNIDSLVLDTKQTVTAELFVDCTGFSGVLVNKALKRDFHSYSDMLFNDAAVAIQTPKVTEQLESKTISAAMSCGWRWQIPLRNRDGNGYVYSSKYLSSDEAEHELRSLLPEQGKGCHARHIKMRVGRLNEHFLGNCLAVGLSQGFIEPLEATALMLVQYTVMSYINGVENEYSAEKLNKKINDQFDSVRDYVVCHYKINSKEGKYWQDCRENNSISANLNAILQAWTSSGDFESSYKELLGDSAYAKASWYSILCGMGLSDLDIEAGTTLDSLATKALAYCEDTADLFIDQAELFASDNTQ